MTDKIQLIASKDTKWGEKIGTGRQYLSGDEEGARSTFGVKRAVKATYSSK